MSVEDSTGRLLQQAVELDKAGQSAEAAGLYRKILTLEPANAYANYLLGVQAFRNGKHDEAIHLIRLAIDRQPDEPTFHLYLGQACQAQDDNEQALAAYDRVLKLNPRHAPAQYRRGIVLAALGRSEEAIAAWQVACQLDPAMSVAFIRLGRSLLDAGKLEEANHYLRALLAREPDNTEALLTLGEVLKAQRQHDEALVCFDRVIALRPQQADAWMRKGEVLLAQDHHVEARENYQHLFRMQRDIPGGQHGFVASPGNAKDISPITVFPFYLENLLEHIEYLLEDGRLDVSYRNMAAVLRAILDAEVGDNSEYDQLVTISSVHADAIRGYYDRALYITDTAPPASTAINEQLDFRAIEDSYLDAAVPMVTFDDFLSAEALNALYEFCLSATIFHRMSHNGFLSSYVYEGFNCSVLYQIAAELKQRFPRVLGDKELRNMWVYRQPCKGEGVRPHSDQAAVTVNFWITPDSANLDPEHGGLVVYDREQPYEWDWREINLFKDSPRILRRMYDYLEGAATVTVPYRENRALMFHSNLFHASDRFHFRDGYRNRRMNVTLLFGERG